MKNSIVLGTAAAAILSSSAVFAELTANATIASNYIWRGVTQTSDQAAGQGGIDWSHDSGLYVGTWLSNIDFSGMGDGYEQDVYVGFGGEAGGIGYDLGVATYMYPVTPQFNFTEVYASGTFSVVTLSVAYTADAASGNQNGVFDDGDLYVGGSLDFSPGPDISIYAGSYMFDNDQKFGNGELDYVHYGASIGKDGFVLAIDKNDIDSNHGLASGATDDNVRVSVSYTMDFELM